MSNAARTSIVLWACDFAFIGAMTGFLAPFPILRDVHYSVAASVGGAVGGAVLGALLATLSMRLSSWSSEGVFVMGGGVGVLWGLAAALGTAGVDRGSFVLSCLFACSAAAVQAAWVCPLYLRRRLAGQSTFAVLLGASFASPFLGLVGFVWFFMPKCIS